MFDNRGCGLVPGKVCFLEVFIYGCDHVNLHDSVVLCQGDRFNNDGLNHNIYVGWRAYGAWRQTCEEEACGQAKKLFNMTAARSGQRQAPGAKRAGSGAVGRKIKF